MVTLFVVRCSITVSIGNTRGGRCYLRERSSFPIVKKEFFVFAPILPVEVPFCTKLDRLDSQFEERQREWETPP